MENFSVTENAANQIKKILEQEAPGSMLRISVQGGVAQAFLIHSQLMILLLLMTSSYA